MPNIDKRKIHKNMIQCTQLHFNMCKETGVKLDKKYWYQHVPKSVETSQGGKVTILWNQQVQTDRTMDVIKRDNERGKCTLIDVAISGDRNVIKKKAERILKYKDFRIEIQGMCNVKTNVIPVIIGATGTISKSFRKYMSNISRKHKINKLQEKTFWALHTYFRNY
jgi:hypothetical protein